MDERKTTIREDRRKTPSFSSSLLDAIYRSIDESNGDEERELVFCKETITARKKQSSTRGLRLELDEEEIPSLRRTIMIDKWMEKRSYSARSSRHLNSNSSSSDSSSGGVFSSSETESGYKSTPKLSVSTMQRPKQARIGTVSRSEKVTHLEQTPKREGRFMRTTKSRALKIYGDLKKAKQPISPGGRIASFLNSIFNSRNAKPPKLHEAMEDLSSIRKSRSVKDHSTTCSSVPSFSRSCLSKTPSSRGKSSGSNGLKRSVKFVDEDCRPCGQKNIYEDAKNKFKEKSNAAGDSFRGFQVKKSVNRYEFRGFHDDNDGDDDDDDDEVESCSSSDLFELQNIGPVGIGAYTEELPVYGTTSLKTNQAIANGLIP